MAQLKQVNKIRLYEQVLEQINGFIERGEWKPGCKIPSEKELREQLGVGTAVLRETFRILESRNLIESRQGQGRILRNVRPELIWDDVTFSGSVLNKSALLDVLDIRINLDISAVEMLISRGTNEQIEEIETIIEQETWDNPVDLATTFEVCVARATGNIILTSIITKLITLTRELQQRNYLGYEKWKILNDEHRIILKAIKDRDLVSGRAAVYHHISNIKKELISGNS